MALGEPLRIGFVLHSMGVAGAEVLVSAILERARGELQPTIFCLDSIGELGRRLQTEGVELRLLERRPGVDPRLPGRLARSIREHGVRLVHAHQYTPFFYAALAKLRPRSDFKLVLTEHGRHYPDRVSRRRRVANRWLLAQRADAITGCSDFSRQGLARNDGFPEQRIQLIPNGIDLARFPPASGDRRERRQALGLAADRDLIVCVARFHPVKDHPTLVRAFARLAGRRSDVDLALVGEGELRGDLEEQVATLGLRDRVHFLGVRRDVGDVLRAADVFCMTSLSEAASLTVLEAMASSTPVVLTHVGGNPELVRPGDEGLLVPRGDDEATAEALDRLLADREEAARMGRAGRRRVEAEFDLQRTVEAYLQLYRRTLAIETRS